MELEAIERAVAGDPADAELALIVTEARATAPRMTTAFEARLESAVAAGFPKPAAKRRAWLRPGPALGLAGAAAMAVAVAVTVLPGDGTHTTDLVVPSHTDATSGG